MQWWLITAPIWIPLIVMLATHKMLVWHTRIQKKRRMTKKKQSEIKKEYSREWIEIHNLDRKWDFDIMEEFDMTPGDTVSIRECAGFGFEGVARRRGRCYLAYPGDVYVPYKKAINEAKKKYGKQKR